MLEPSRHEKGLSPDLAKSGIQDGSQGKTTPNAVNTLPTPVKTHTPLPWVIEDDDWVISIFGTAKNGDDWTICDMGLPVDLAGMNIDNLSQRILDERADAALIVRAVNSHDDLLTLAHQYASDLRHPPSAESVERRLERIAAMTQKARSFRLIQDGQNVAGSQGPNALAHINHYALVYSQEGPVKIQERINGRWKDYRGEPKDTQP